ncbi:hypothetical protein [Streptomyces sp. NPDC050759]|uniref:hypothetical protein n=1 Tax=Streptomyces sp. NPDC050759 TaxID=3365635 RepID=UPI0037A18422
MTSDDSSLSSPLGIPAYAEADSSFPLAAPVDPAGAFTARSIDDVVRAAARRAGWLLLNTTGHAMGRTAALNGSLVLRPLIDAPVGVDPETRTARVPAGKTRGDIRPSG